MPTRVQSLKYGLSSGKQSDISTIAATFLRFRKLNLDIQTLRYNTEDDSGEIGKGSEFATQVFPVAYDFEGRIEKFGSAEFVLWAWAYALGDSSGATPYAIAPIDPNVTLELPYFTAIQQLGEGGGTAIDEAYLGCAVDDVETVFNYGQGRQSLRTTVNIVGSGRHTIPSGVTLPSTLSEHYMLSQSAAITINGVDYVSAKTALNGTISWRNNLLRNAGYFIGSGTIDNAALRGRLEIGARACGFVFTARLLSTSTEYAHLISQTTGSATITFTYDATHTVTFSMPTVSFRAVERTEADGIVAVTVTVAPKSTTDTGTDVLAVSGQCGVTGLAQ